MPAGGDLFDPSLIVFAVLAVFVIWKLRSVLGVRVDRETPPPSRFEPRRPAAAVATPGEPLVFRPPVASGPSAAPALPDRPAIGPTQQLTGAGAATELAKRTPVRATDSPAPAQALARHIFVQGGDQNPRPNRADDYRWRPPAPAAEDSLQR
ncbi:hypothetical protein V3H18_12315 [Methylocystis sp. 9N]|uniref:Calcium-binding protein n=1 Tax=Methylocystis borbori TaxID=3118750 RepID=A0ABU7XIX5_9HYPH